MSLKVTSNRRVLRRAEIVLFLVLAAMAVYLWTAPRLAERALQNASLHDLILASQHNPQNPRVFYYLGRRYEQTGDRQAAYAAYMHAAKTDGNDEESWLAWAAASSALGKEDDAFQILTTFARYHPHSAPTHFALARLYRQNQAHKRALEEARATVKEDPQNAEAWLLNGEEALNWNLLPEAAAAMRQAMTLTPHDWRAQVGLGNVLMEQKRNDAAIGNFREAVRLAPQEALAQLCLGRALLMEAKTPADIETARQNLLQAVSLQPEMAPAYVSLGQSYSQQARPKEARDVLEKAERIAPNNADVAFALSGVYRSLGDLVGADREARRHKTLKDYAQQKYALISRIEAAPDDMQTRLEVARLCKAHGDEADARYFYRSLLARDPNSEAARRELADLETRQARASLPAAAVPVSTRQPSAGDSEETLLQQGDSLLARQDLEGAKRLYLAVLAKNRDSAPACQGVGLILNAQGMGEDAFLFLEHAVRLDPRLPQAQYLLAQRYREAGFAEEAIWRMKQAMKEEPNNAAYWHELGMDYGDSDDAQAEQAYQRAVTLEPNNAAYRLDLADRQADNSRGAEAEQNYRRAVALAPDSSDALSRLGGFLLNADSTPASRQEAEGLLKRALERQPDNEYALYNLGHLAVKQGDARQAAAYFERVTAEYPDIADAWYALSQADMRLGDHARAETAAAHSRQLRQDYIERTHTAELLRLHPNDPALHLKLARLSAKKGDNARAILEYRLCLRFAPKNGPARRELDALTAYLKAKGHMPAMSIFTAMMAGMTHHTEVLSQ